MLTRCLQILRGDLPQKKKRRQLSYRKKTLRVEQLEVREMLAAASEGLVAFPGAEGAGAFSVGGRKGDVYYVTNLNDDGEGSFRQAIETADGPRTIVFGVSGNIDLQSPIIIDKPHLTIAGQTAPGDGITFMHHDLSIRNTHDVILQYIRFRPGDLATESEVYEPDAFGIHNSKDIIIDHVSASWSTDEVLSVINGSDGITVQWSLITEALHNSNHSKGNHGYGSLINGKDITFHHNLYAHNRSRNPRPQINDFNTRLDFVNNVIYNPGSRFGYGDGDEDRTLSINYVSNYGIAGPDTSSTSLYHSTSSDTHIYQQGNFIDLDQDQLLNGLDLGWDSFAGPETQLSERINLPQVETDPAEIAYQRVIEFAGASLARDEVDRRVIHELVTRTGTHIDSQMEVGGWPTLVSQPMLLDSDLDGMPDKYELAQGFNINNARDRNHDANKDGYTNLENYLHSLTATPKFLHEPCREQTLEYQGAEDILFDIAFVRTSTETASDGSICLIPESTSVEHEWDPFYVEIYATFPSELPHELHDLKLLIDYDAAHLQLDLENIETGIKVDPKYANLLTNQLEIVLDIDNFAPYLGLDRPFLVARIPVSNPVSANILGDYPAESSTGWPSITIITTEPENMEIGVNDASTNQAEIAIKAIRYDINDNNVVDLADLSLLVSTFGESTANDSKSFRADLNFDGVVSLDDLILLIQHFGLSKEDHESSSLHIESSINSLNAILEQEPIQELDSTHKESQKEYPELILYLSPSKLTKNEVKLDTQSDEVIAIIDKLLENPISFIEDEYRLLEVTINEKSLIDHATVEKEPVNLLEDHLATLDDILYEIKK